MLKPLELAAQEIVDAVSELTESTASSPLLDPKSDIYSKMIESKMEWNRFWRHCLGRGHREINFVVTQ